MNSQNKASALRLELRKVEEKDLKKLAAFASDSFVAAFGRAAPAELVDAYVASDLNVEKLKEAWLKSSVRFFFAEVDDAGYGARVVCYWKLEERPVPSSCQGAKGRKGSLFLERVYVDPQLTGRGIGSWAMDQVFDLIREEERPSLWLEVWEGNLAGIRFYERLGFRDLGRSPYKFYSEAENRLDQDWIMEWIPPVLA